MVAAPEDVEALKAALLAERTRAARVEAELAIANAKASDDAAVRGGDRRRGRYIQVLAFFLQ